MQLKLAIPAVSLAVAAYVGVTLAPQPSDDYIRKHDSPLQVVRSMVGGFNSQQQPPDVVMLGSSLIKSPMWRTDKEANPKAPGYAAHHEAKAFESALAQTTNNHISVANLAVDGSLASDAYLIFDKLLQGNHTPKLVILGLSPQAFSGYFLSVPTETPVYRALFQPTDCVRISNFYVTNLTDWLNMSLSQINPIYRDRRVYQSFAIAALQQVLGDKDAWNKMALNTTNLDPEALYKAYFKPYLEKTLTTIAASKSPKAQPAAPEDRVLKRMLESTQINDKMFEHQHASLTALIKAAEKRHIQVLLVNMPDTDKHRSGFSKLMLLQYLGDLNQSIAGSHAELLDLSQRSDIFNPSTDFIDGLHLNANGGKKFIAVLTDWMNQNKGKWSGEAATVARNE